MSANVLQEYLVSLGFTIDNPTFHQFNQTMDAAQKTVEAATGGMMTSFGSASTAIVVALGTITIATGTMLHQLGEADMGYQKMATRMWMTKQSAKELQLTLDALGESIEDTAFNPELRGQFQALMGQGRQMAVPQAEYAQQMKDIRSIGFEWKRMKLEASYAIEWVGYYLVKHLAGPLASIKKWFKEFNDTISKSMPVWTEKIAFGVTRLISLFIAWGRYAKWCLGLWKDLWDSIPRGVQTALVAFSILGAALISGPFGVALLTVGALLVLLEDFFYFIDGKNSSEAMKPFWTWLVKTWQEFKAELEKLKATLSEIWEKFKDSEAMQKFKKTWSEFKGMLAEVRVELGKLWDNVKGLFKEFDNEKTKGVVGFLLEYWLGLFDKILQVLTFIGRLWVHLFRGDGAKFLKETLVDIQNWANKKKPGDEGYIAGGTKPASPKTEPTKRPSGPPKENSGEWWDGRYNPDKKPGAAGDGHYQELANKASAKTGVPAELIYGQWAHETGNFSHMAAPNNLAGLTQPEPNAYPQPDGGNYYIPFASEDEFVDKYAWWIDEPQFKNVKTPEEMAAALKSIKYFTDDEDKYAAGIRRHSENYPTQTAKGGSSDLSFKGANTERTLAKSDGAETAASSFASRNMPVEPVASGKISSPSDGYASKGEPENKDRSLFAQVARGIGDTFAIYATALQNQFTDKDTAVAQSNKTDLPLGGFAPTTNYGGTIISTTNQITVPTPAGSDAISTAEAIAKALEPYQGRAQIRIIHQMREMQGVQA